MGTPIREALKGKGEGVQPNLPVITMVLEKEFSTGMTTFRIWLD